MNDSFKILPRAAVPAHFVCAVLVVYIVGTLGTHPWVFPDFLQALT